MDIKSYLKDAWRADIVRGPVSLDNETVEGSCTGVIPGRHRRIVDWWDDLVMRTKAKGLKKSGQVENVANMYVQEHSEKYEDLS